MNKIAEQRSKLKLSQRELAEKCGWKQTRLANYEVGRTPKLDDCRKLVSVLNRLGCKCSLDDVFPPEDCKSAA